MLSKRSCLCRYSRHRYHGYRFTLSYVTQPRLRRLSISIRALHTSGHTAVPLHPHPQLHLHPWRAHLVLPQQVHGFRLHPFLEKHPAPSTLPALPRSSLDYTFPTFPLLKTLPSTPLTLPVFSLPRSILIQHVECDRLLQSSWISFLALRFSRMHCTILLHAYVSIVLTLHICVGFVTYRCPSLTM